MADQILGMNPENFSAMFGGIGSAISPAGSIGDKLGQLAQNIGMAQIQATTVQESNKQSMKNLQEFIAKGGDIKKITPEQMKALGLDFDFSLTSGVPGAENPFKGFNTKPTPAFSGASAKTGLETGAQTPPKLSEANSYFGSGSWFAK